MVFYGLNGRTCCINGRAAAFPPPVLTIRASGIPQIYIEGNDILPSASYTGLHSGSAYVSSLSSDDGYYNLRIDELKKTIGYFPKVSISGIDGITEFPEECLDYTGVPTHTVTSHNLSGIYRIPTSLLAGGGTIDITTSNMPMMVTATTHFYSTGSGYNSPLSQSVLCGLSHETLSLSISSNHKLPTAGNMMASSTYDRTEVTARGVLNATRAYWGTTTIAEYGIINQQKGEYIAGIENSASSSDGNSATAWMTATSTSRGSSTGWLGLYTSTNPVGCRSYLCTNYSGIGRYAFEASGYWSGTARV